MQVLLHYSLTYPIYAGVITLYSLTYPIYAGAPVLAGLLFQPLTLVDLGGAELPRESLLTEAGVAQHPVHTSRVLPTLVILHNTGRRVNTEEKAKVVAAVWVAECIQFLAALAILH